MLKGKTDYFDWAMASIAFSVSLPGRVSHGWANDPRSELTGRPQIELPILSIYYV